MAHLTEGLLTLQNLMGDTGIEPVNQSTGQPVDWFMTGPRSDLEDLEGPTLKVRPWKVKDNTHLNKLRKNDFCAPELRVLRTFEKTNVCVWL